MFPGDGLCLHPIPDHCKLGLAITIFSGNLRSDVMIDRRRLRGNSVRPQQTGHLRHVKGIGGTGDDNTIPVSPIGIDPVECGSKDVAGEGATGKSGRNPRQRRGVDPFAHHQ